MRGARLALANLTDVSTRDLFGYAQTLARLHPTSYAAPPDTVTFSGCRRSWAKRLHTALTDEPDDPRAPASDADALAASIV